jgi:hypothetical protein
MMLVTDTRLVAQAVVRDFCTGVQIGLHCRLTTGLVFQVESIVHSNLMKFMSKRHFTFVAAGQLPSLSLPIGTIMASCWTQRNCAQMYVIRRYSKCESRLALGLRLLLIISDHCLMHFQQYWSAVISRKEIATT